MSTEEANNIHSQYLDIAMQAKSKLPYVLNNKDGIKTVSCYFQYGIGGMNLHRGWYCPSIVKDIVTGNCSRGRLVHQPKNTTKIAFKYFFDDNDRLSIVDSYYMGRYVSSEFIVYEDSVVRGFTLLPNNTLMRYSEENYDEGLCSSYHCLDYNPINQVPYNYHYELYSVDNFKMMCEITDYYLDIKRHNTRYYMFDLDSEYYLKSYVYSPNKIFSSDERVRHVSVQRTIKK